MPPEPRAFPSVAVRDLLGIARAIGTALRSALDMARGAPAWGVFRDAGGTSGYSIGVHAPPEPWMTILSIGACTVGIAITRALGWRDAREYVESITIAVVVAAVLQRTPPSWRPVEFGALALAIGIFAWLAFRRRRA